MKISRPPFEKFPILKNQRIILRELQDADIPQLIEISFYDGIPAKDLLDAQIMNGTIKSDYMNGNSIHWIITSVSNGEVIGTCGFYRGFRTNIGEVGYVLKKAHQGKGYMAEALSMMLDFGWKELELKTITAMTSEDNQPSINVLRKAGFKEIETKENEKVFLLRKST